MGHLGVLLVNHRESNCGVAQFGKRILLPALSSAKYDCSYIEVNEAWEFEHWASQLSPSIVVYNYYPSTMSWVTAQFINEHRERFKQIAVFHEVPILHLGFDAIAHQDPSGTDNFGFPMSRPIPEYITYLPIPERPTFGSFGFGLGGKGFDRIIDRVEQEYDNAIIRLNIPFAAFGDSSGSGARSWAQACLQKCKKSELVITHDLLPERELLDWLATNTCNCFFYDENYGRGISGTLDYAIASNRPIAITKSWQFKHFWSLTDKANIESHTLQEIVKQGTDYFSIFHEKWGNRNLLRDWEALFSAV